MLTNISHTLILTFIFLLLTWNNGQATHIVGGEMRYKCLGDNEYEINLTIFRDCFNGSPQALFDDPAAIGIYDAQGLLVDSLFIPLMNNDTLDPILSSECFLVPPDVCVHTTTYSSTVTLPPIIGGYQLIYQRCCRNQTLNNIVDPLDTGATYGVGISEKALLECNNSPVFNAWPPIYICVNEPISFDQSAFDLDGDSIVYRLCTPLSGANPTRPQPQPWAQTIPEEVVWVNPPYNESNMLNGLGLGNVLTINSETGLLTGTPNTVGQFVVGICLEEYRDGQLISTVRRDFQYNVGVCGETISSFFSPEIVCDGFDVLFVNQSENAGNFIWMVEDLQNPDDPISFQESFNFNWIFPALGDYEVTLIAEPGAVCVDTFSQIISIETLTLEPAFEVDFVDCSDSLTINVIDQSVDPQNGIVNWQWILTDEDGAVTDTSSMQNPSFNILATGEYELTLLATSGNGCIAELNQVFPAQLIELNLLPDSTIICLGDSVALNPPGNESYTYEWFPNLEIDDNTSANPSVSPSATRTYFVTVTDAENFCQIERSVTIILPELVDISAPPDTTTCEPTLNLTAVSDLAQVFVWALDDEFENVIVENEEVEVTPLGAVNYYVLGRDVYGCIAVDSILVVGNGVNVNIENPVLCPGEEASIEAENLDPDDTLTFLWSPDSLLTSLNDLSTITSQPTESGIWTIYVELENQLNCTLLDSAIITVLDTTPQAQFVSAIQCADFTVSFENTSINAPFYIWNFGDPLTTSDTSTVSNPFYTYPGEGTYNVTLTLNQDLNCPDTFTQQITIVDSNIDIDFEFDYESCFADSSILIQFTNTSQNSQSTFTEFLWTFSNGTESTESNPLIEVSENGDFFANLTVTSDDGCIDQYEQRLDIEIPTFNFLENYTACAFTPTPLVFNAPSDYNYEWSPSEFVTNQGPPWPTVILSETTLFTVEVNAISSDTCSFTREVLVTVPESIDYMVSEDLTNCGQPVYIEAESEDATAFQWSLNDQFFPSISTESLIEVSALFDRTFFVEITDSIGCTQLDSVKIFSNAVNVSLPDFTLCVGDTITIAAQNLDEEDVLNYQWSPNATILSGLDMESIRVNADQSQTYEVQVSNQFACTATAQSRLSIFDFMPNLNVFADPDTILQGESTTLIAEDLPGFEYLWSPSETLENPNNSSTFASPLESTIYQLNIENEDGCSNRFSVPIIVLLPICEEPYIFFPNAFTPNNDGENDELTVIGNFIDEVYFAIYNRWGQMVFESNSINDAWDGTHNGEVLEPDVFGYYLTVRCLNGQEFKKQGNVSLLR